MKTGDAYRFTLSWQKDTEERSIAGEFLEKLGNKKSKFIVQLICDYIAAHPEAVNSKETINFIVNSTPLSDILTEKIQLMIKNELAGKVTLQPPLDNSNSEAVAPEANEKVKSNSDESIDGMFGNLDMWNNA